MPAVWFMVGTIPHGRFQPMANSSIFHGKRLRWLSRTISAWNTAPFDHRSRNLLPGKCVFSRRPSSTRPDPCPQDRHETIGCHSRNHAYVVVEGRDALAGKDHSAAWGAAGFAKS